MRTCLDTNWIQVGHIDEIPRLGARVVKTEQGDIAVFRNAGDEIFALLDRCPHKGGPLSQGIVFDQRVTCPLHNWVISLESGEATGPDSGCTNQYPVRIEDNMIYLLLDKTGARPVEYKKAAEA
jgi:nitrite reductase (NADH) small subunit